MNVLLAEGNICTFGTTSLTVDIDNTCSGLFELLLTLS